MNRDMKTVVLMPREGAVKVEEKTWFLRIRGNISEEVIERKAGSHFLLDKSETTKRLSSHKYTLQSSRLK